MTNLWNVTAKREGGKIVKGMNVEIPISDRTSKPRAKEISNALQSKYNVAIDETRCTETYFEIVKL